MATQTRTRLRADAADNRARILAAARVALATRGIDVPTREIARSAGVSAPTLYRHFPTREALLSEAFAEQMASCVSILDEGLSHHDPWQGFCLVVEKLMALHALDRGLARAFTSRLAPAVELAAESDRVSPLLLELVRRAKEAGHLRSDVVAEDLVLVLMANEGIRAEDPEKKAAASRRFAALVLESFHAGPISTPLPPSGPLARSTREANTGPR